MSNESGIFHVLIVKRKKTNEKPVQKNPINISRVFPVEITFQDFKKTLNDPNTKVD